MPEAIPSNLIEFIAKSPTVAVISAVAMMLWFGKWTVERVLKAFEVMHNEHMIARKDCSEAIKANTESNCRLADNIEAVLKSRI